MLNTPRNTLTAAPSTKAVVRRPTEKHSSKGTIHFQHQISPGPGHNSHDGKQEPASLSKQIMLRELRRLR